jgi:hypothetical protein
MMEEYQSIRKNDVRDIVLRPEAKFVVTSKWIYCYKNGCARLTIDNIVDFSVFSHFCNLSQSRFQSLLITPNV